MEQDRIEARCQAMTNRELVMALTLERHENSSRFIVFAEHHLENRGVVLADFINRVRVHVDGTDSRALPIDMAVQLLDHAEVFQVVSFVNCLDHSLIAQRELRQWCCHYYDGEHYSGSFFACSHAEVSRLLTALLKLEHWRDQVDQLHHLDDWRQILEVDSNASDFLTAIIDELDKAGIPHAVKMPLFERTDEDEQYSVLVPGSHLDAAFDVIDEIDESVDDLYHKAETLAEAGNLASELEIYNLLVKTDSENHAVYYNRGQILLEMGRTEEAANALVEAVSRGLEQVDQSLDTQPKSLTGLGGLAGMLAFLLRRRVFPVVSPSYPDFLDDCDLLLQPLSQKLGDRTDILHALAAIARLKNDQARAAEYYRLILEIHPADKTAYFNLGYIHSEKNSGQNTG